MKCVGKAFRAFWVSFAIYSLLASVLWAQELPVFPGAVGYGTSTVAGSGRHLSTPATNIYFVTNLNDSGSGSLRECAEATQPRVCIFEKSGVIELQSAIDIRYPYITIAGQTAPSPGVTIIGAGLRIGSHDVLVQHLAIRVGDNPNGPDPGSRDGIAVARLSSSAAAYNVVIDHVSITWAIDENLSTWYDNTHDVTFSHLLVAEGLNDSIHPKGPHSKGVMIGDYTQRLSMHHSLIAHNWERNPYFKPGVTAEFVNNVVYGWGGAGSYAMLNVSDSSGIGAPVYLNYIGNYYKPAPYSPTRATLYGKPIDSGTRIFVSHNIGPKRPSDSGSEWLVAGFDENPHRAASPIVDETGIAPLVPTDTMPYVLSNAGTRPAERDSIDSRIINQVLNGTGTIIDCVEGCANSAGGWPIVAETSRTLDLPNNPHSDDNNDGYTNLENWLHDFQALVEGEPLPPTPTPTATPSPSISPTTTATPTSTSTPKSSPSTSPSPTPSVSTPAPSVAPSSVASPSPSASAEPSSSSTPLPSATPPGRRPKKALPHGVGFGVTTTAGFGDATITEEPEIVLVKTRGSKGKGSLSDCVQKRTTDRPRVCVFEVSGEIKLKDDLQIDSPYLTIAGQTAPSPGIVLVGAGVVVNTHDVLIEHIAIRPGDRTKGPVREMRDALRIGTSDGETPHNIVLSHLSLSWALRAGLAIVRSDAHDITLIDSIVGESLPQGPKGQGERSMGLYLEPGVQKVSFIRNAFAHLPDRMEEMFNGDTIEFVNNIVYNWQGANGALSNTKRTDGKTSKNKRGKRKKRKARNQSKASNRRVRMHGDTSAVHVLNNIYLPGSNTGTSSKTWRVSLDRLGTIQFGGNLIELDGQFTLLELFSSALTQTEEALFDPSYEAILSALEAFPYVLRNAGPFPSAGQRTDNRIVNQIQSRSGSYQNCVSGCKTDLHWPKVPAKRVRLTLPLEPFADADGDGYNQFEEWLQQLRITIEGSID
ncbi:MAG: hypothetical protein KDD62_05090 [Bdellovibrionales bacterium]|nr:hypothetical protein [Bdellovibrionales bacterium]